MIDFNSHAQLGTTEEAVHDPMPTSVLQVQLIDTTTQVPLLYRECIQTVISTANKPKCPLCKEPISRRLVHDNNYTMIFRILQSMP